MGRYDLKFDFMMFQFLMKKICLAAIAIQISFLYLKLKREN